MKMLDIVGRKREKKARFSFYREGKMYYEIINTKGKAEWIFPVNIFDKKDIGSATFSAEHKAINLMRYIRKAKEDETLAKIY